MLIELRVQNYRSIKEEQRLSLVAATDKTHAAGHLIATKNRTLPHLVKSAVLYGANASGKSNLINALIFMRALVAESATVIQLGQTFNLQPFRLDTKTITEPSEFEITFFEEDIRYQYGFKLTAERIHEEWLLVYKTSKPQHWFARRYDKETDGDVYEFGSHLTGQRKLWQESTRPNALFLSTAVHLNSEQLRPVFNWMVNKLVSFTAGTHPISGYSIAMLQNNEKKRDIEAFMISADISITNIEVISRKGCSQLYQFDLDSGKASNLQNVESDALFPQFHHKTKNGSAIFELQDESLGTQRLFCLAGPVLDILNQGKVLIVDELDSSLHPLLVKRLIGIFHDPKLNTQGAQLVFTTHDTSLLDKTIFRRDQIWFIEKDRNQASTLYPLSDFSPRKHEALESGYLMGRYGAIPFFHDLEAE